MEVVRQAGAILNDLSKAFYCIHHWLLIAKLYAYGFDKNVLNFILIRIWRDGNKEQK